MEISAKLVKELRDRTGAGMMDCKAALKESKGDLEKASEWLRKKGISKAEKREGRETKEGLVEAYIHPGNRLGVLIEINCETDFVAKTDDFKKFARNMAMQVAAANPIVINREDVPQDLIDKEKDVYYNQALNEKKPEKIIDKLVEGKLLKYFQEVCLMEQNYIKDPNKTVRDVMTEVIAKTGENITIRRFSRFQLGG
ncbi:translation elongation factor Ts [candidate division KSB1 bacterium]|nr:translation elongation factor Ts [candidate division KSB1 bacterium]